MLKRKHILTAFIIICVILLASCGKNDNDNLQNGVLYAPGSTLSIVASDDTPDDYAVNIVNAVGKVTGSFPSVVKDNTAAGEHEIVIGMTDRAISKAAYEQLESVDKETEYEVAYLIYSDGNSVAIAFESDDYGHNIALEKAVSAFIELMGNKTTFTLKVGKLIRDTIDPLTVIEQKDAEKIEEKWSALKTAIVSNLASYDGTLTDAGGNELSKDAYAELGKAAYKHFSEDESSAETVAATMTLVEEAQKAVDALNAEIEAVKADDPTKKASEE